MSANRFNEQKQEFKDDLPKVSEDKSQKDLKDTTTKNNPVLDDKACQELIISAKENVSLIKHITDALNSNHLYVGDYNGPRVEELKNITTTLAAILKVEYSSEKLTTKEQWLRAAQLFSIATCIIAQSDPSETSKSYRSEVYECLQIATCCLNNGSGYKIWTYSPFNGYQDMWDCQKNTIQSYTKCVEMLTRLWNSIKQKTSGESFDMKCRPESYSAGHALKLMGLLRHLESDFSCDAAGISEACDILYKRMTNVPSVKNEESPKKLIRMRDKS